MFAPKGPRWGKALTLAVVEPNVYPQRGVPSGETIRLSVDQDGHLPQGGPLRRQRSDRRRNEPHNLPQGVPSGGNDRLPAERAAQSPPRVPSGGKRSAPGGTSRTIFPQGVPAG